MVQSCNHLLFVISSSELFLPIFMFVLSSTASSSRLLFSSYIIYLGCVYLSSSIKSASPRRSRALPPLTADLSHTPVRCCIFLFFLIFCTLSPTAELYPQLPGFSDKQVRCAHLTAGVRGSVDFVYFV